MLCVVGVGMQIWRSAHAAQLNSLKPNSLNVLTLVLIEWPKTHSLSVKVVLGWQDGGKVCSGGLCKGAVLVHCAPNLQASWP